MIQEVRASVLWVGLGLLVASCTVNVQDESEKPGKGGKTAVDPTESVGGAVSAGGSPSVGGAPSGGGTNTSTGGSTSGASAGVGSAGTASTHAGGASVAGAAGTIPVVAVAGGTAGGGSGAGGGTATWAGGSIATAGSAGALAVAGSAGLGVDVKSDPCLGISTLGECFGTSVLMRCATPTGDGQPQLATVVCAAGSQCGKIFDVAVCIPVGGKCTPGEQSCVTSSRIKTCDSSGNWQEVDCPSVCRPSALGAFCNETSTTTYANTLAYESKGPDASFTDWSTSVVKGPAVGVMIISKRSDALVDATTVDSTGAFQIQIPSPWQTGDQLVAVLVNANDTGTGFAFAVAQPGVGDGEVDAVRGPPGTNPSLWMWNIDPQTSPPGSGLLITESLGSGAVRVFDYLRYAYAVARNEYGKPGKSLVIWLRQNTSWSCGACFNDVPVAIGSMEFESQIMIPALARDESYWADPVTVHELGHWAMASYGRPPGEGGPHCAGQPTLPGQAWSEGWATAFSSLVRGNSVYYDKQDGSMFWLDLNARQYARGVTWIRPTPSGGLLQWIDENEVGASLWLLGNRTEIGRTSLFNSLASPRMTTAPFARSYTRHTWQVTSCQISDVRDRYESVPVFADFLDSLRCAGVPAATIDATLDTATYYPYPSNSPICL